MEAPPSRSDSLSSSKSSRLSVNLPRESLWSAMSSTSKYFAAERLKRQSKPNRVTMWLDDDATRGPSSDYSGADSIHSIEKDFPKPPQRATFRHSIQNGFRNSFLLGAVRYEDERPRLTMLVPESQEKLHRYSTAGALEGQETSEAAGPHEDYATGYKLFLIVFALCCAVFVMALDNSIIATAIPKITADFESLNDVGWYGSAYMLTGASLQLFFGKLYTFWSIKWIFLVAIGIFEVGSLVCAIAQNSVTLIIGRAVAGIGSAGIFAGALTILAYSVPLSKRPLYTGLIGGMFGISSVAGPLVGGVFTDSVTWRWCFYINLPIGFITVVVISVFFPDPDRKIAPATWKQRIWQLDPIGTAVFTPAVVCVLLALQWGGVDYEWSDSRVTSLLMLSGVLSILFCYIQWRMGENATVPARIFKQRDVWASSMFEFFTGACFLESLYFLPIWFQAVQNQTPIMSGVRNIPMLLGNVLSSVVAGTLVTRYGYYTPFMIIGAVFMPIGYGLLSSLEVDSSTGAWIGYQVIAGIGVGLGMQQPLIAVQVVLDIADVPTGTALVIFFQSLGGALFVSAGQTVFSSALTRGVKDIPEIHAEAILAAGSEFRDVFPENLWDQLEEVFNTAVNETLYVSAATAAVTIFFAVLISWKSVKGKNIEMSGG
jgi:EmrB/QacA subfamily drug resistance transporter